MKTTRKILVGAIVGSFIGVVHALPVTHTDPIALSPAGQIISNTPSATVSVDLGTYGYDSTLYLLETAILSLTFAISTNGNPGSSLVTVALADHSAATFTEGNSVADLNSGSLAQFLALGPSHQPGILDFVISRSNNGGTVTLSGASLTVSGSLRETGNPVDPVDPVDPIDPLQAVPEPGTLALLGLGLAGLAAGMRRRRRI